MPKPEGELPRVLAILDVGLQQTTENAYGTDVLPDLCARCQRSEPADGELCSGCRAYLLGDSDVDPSTRDRHADFMQTLIDSLNRPVEAGARAATQVASRFHATSPVRVQRLDRDGVPTGEPEELSGYVVHHVNGDSRDNRMENLRLMPARENATQNQTPWARQQYVGDGRSVWSYAGWGASGSYATDDPRPFTVAEYVEGPWRGAQLLNADDVTVHFMANARPDYDYPLPAAYRVSSTIAVPEWYAVTCDRCGAIYACDPQRTYEAAEIMYADGHGLAGACDPLTRTRRPPYDWQQERDWQAEAYAWLGQIVSDARARLGL